MKKATYNKLQGLKNKIQSLEKELEAARQNLAGKSDAIPVGNSQKKLMNQKSFGLTKAILNLIYLNLRTTYL